MAPETQTPSSKSKTLTLPAPIIATLSPRPYLLAHLQAPQSIRPNGRGPSSFRAPTCSISSLSHCAGSAVVRVGDTAVACGIQGELLYSKDIADNSALPLASSTTGGQNHDRQQTQPEDSGAEARKDDYDILERLQLLVPNIDLATGCSPQHLPGAGAPPSSFAQALSHRLYRLLLSSHLIRLEDLTIMHEPLSKDSVADDLNTAQQHPEIVAYWTLHISLTVLSLAGTTSLLDALWSCLLAALVDVKLPKAWWDPDREIVLCSDLVSDAKQLSLQGRPFMASWGIFEGRMEDAYMDTQTDNKNTSLNGNSGAFSNDRAGLPHRKELGSNRLAWFLADPDSFEDTLCPETVSIVVDCSTSETQVLRVEKNGGRVIGYNELNELIDAAAERWKSWNSVVPILRS